MTDQHHLLRAIRDVARMIEKVEPVVADAALAHQFAGTIARTADKEEYLNPTSQARIRSNHLWAISFSNKSSHGTSRHCRDTIAAWCNDIRRPMLREQCSSYQVLSDTMAQDLACC